MNPQPAYPIRPYPQTGPAGESVMTCSAELRIYRPEGAPPLDARAFGRALALGAVIACAASAAVFAALQLWS